MSLRSRWAASRVSGFATKAYLIGQFGEGDSFHVELTAQPFTIGRAAEVNLQVSDDGVSRLHCEIWQSPGGYHLRDLSSRNGTWLNDWRIREAPLCEGDWIRVGNFRLRYSHTPVGRALHIGETIGGEAESAITASSRATMPVSAGMNRSVAGINPTVHANVSLFSGMSKQ